MVIDQLDIFVINHKEFKKEMVNMDINDIKITIEETIIRAK